MSAPSIVSAHPLLRSSSQAESSKQSSSNTFIENISDSLDINIITFLPTIAGYSIYYIINILRQVNVKISPSTIRTRPIFTNTLTPGRFVVRHPVKSLQIRHGV